MKRIISVLLVAAMLFAGYFPGMESKAAEAVVQFCEADSGTAGGVSSALLRKKSAELQQKLGGNADAAARREQNIPAAYPHTMPSVGDVKILVLPVAFPDYPEERDNYSQQEIEEMYMGEYASGVITSRQSVSWFYEWASYGRLKLSATVLPLYEAPQPTTWYMERTPEPKQGRYCFDSGYSAPDLEEMYREAIEYYIEQYGLDLSDYDSDGDGYLDGLVIKPLVPGVRSAEDDYPHWKPRCVERTFSFEGSTVQAAMYAHVATGYKDANTPFFGVENHMIGHLLGLPDHNAGNTLPSLLLDTMGSVGECFNIYEKWLLGWVDPVILTEEDLVNELTETTMDLYATDCLGAGAENTPKAVVLIPKPDQLPFAEFFIAEYRTGESSRIGNNPFRRKKGLVIWHCNTFLDGSGAYLKANSFLKPVTSAEDTTSFYTESVFGKGDVFSSDSEGATSAFYDGSDSGAYLEVVSTDAEKAAVIAGFRDPTVLEEVSLEIAFDPETRPFMKSKSSSKTGVYPATAKKTDTYFPCTLKRDGKPFNKVDVFFPEAKKELALDGAGVEFQTTGTAEPLKNGVYLGKYTFDGEEKLCIRIGSPYYASSGFAGDGTVSFSIPGGTNSEYRGLSFFTKSASPVMIVDNTPPAITIKGDNPLYIRLGDPFVDPGVEITDNLDPDIAGKLITDTTNLHLDTPTVVDPAHDIVPDEIWYFAEDHAGNDAVGANENYTFLFWSKDEKDALWRGVVVYDKPLPTVLTKPKAKTGLVYTGKPQDLLEPGTVENGELQYAILDSQYGSSVPTAVKAGQYAVFYWVKGDDSHNNLYCERIDVTIAKAPRPENIPDDFVVPYGTKLSSLQLPKGWAWRNASQVLAIGENQVMVMCADRANYEQTSFTITVTVEEPEPVVLVTPPAAKSGLVYTGKSQILAEPGKAVGGTIEYSLRENGGYSSNLPTAVNAGEYTVWYRVRNSVSGQTGEPAFFQTAIAKAARPEKIPENRNVADKTVLSSLQLPEGWSWKDPGQALVTGVNRVTVVYADSQNYAQTEFTISVIMDEPDIPVLTAPPTARNGLVYTGEIQTLADPGEAVGGRLEYSLREYGTYTADLPFGLNAGEYTVWYRVRSNRTGTLTDSASFPVTIAKATKPKELPGNLSVPAGTELSSLQLPEGWSWKNAGQELVSGTNRIAVVYEDSQNYEQNEAEILITVVEPEHVHTLVRTRGKAATCTAKGNLEYWTCTDCGCIFSDEKGTMATTPEERILAIIPHTPGEAPTCTTPQRCEVCRTILVKAKGHTPGAAATCTTGQKCLVCKTEIKSSLGHSYSREVTEPTCTEGGYTTRTCTRCGISATDTPTAALGHDPDREAADCTHDKICTRCKIVLEKAPGHSDTVKTTEPTCTEAGYTAHTCNRCGSSSISEILEPLGHSWSQWTQTKAPTTAEAGEERRECSRCGDWEVRELPIHVHTEVKIPAVPATCTKAGLTEGIRCSVCNTVLREQETVPALGHDEQDAVTPPTCTEQGRTTHTCTRCGAVRVDSYIPSLGHDWGEWAEIKAPTCTARGEELRGCSRCTEKETRAIAALGHKPGTEADCTHDQICTVCGAVVERAKGHRPGDWVVVTPATESQEGLRRKECTVCHVVVEQETLPRLTPTPPGPPNPPSPPSPPDPGPEPDPQPPVELPFTDVKEGAWYYEAVSWAYGKELISGTSETTFSPGMTTTRGMIVTILWRLEEKPQSTAAMAFADVRPGAYYYEAVRWAAEEGIVSGRSETKFDPNASITRQELAAILYRYAKLTGSGEILNGTEILRFPDTGDVSDFAKESMTWAVDKEIINGSGGRLNPKGTATRAQVAQVLQNSGNVLTRLKAS